MSDCGIILKVLVPETLRCTKCTSHAAPNSRLTAQVIPVAWLRLFTPAELNQLLGGGQSGRIDVDDLRRHTEYSGGYTERSSAVKAFWSCLEEMSAEERAAVLKFATSTSRPPLGGFQHLVPPFTIHKVRRC